MNKLTVFGHTGFIGSNIVRYAQNKGRELILPKRGQIPKGKLGDVIYAIGVTSGFEEHPCEIVTAHVCFLKEVLENADFENFIYISSARIYYNLTESCANENTNVKVNVLEPSEIYIISKLMGESLCLLFTRKNIKVVRLSSVFGEGMGKNNLLGNVLYQAITLNHVIINQPKNSGRDYVSIDDVIPSIFYIMESGEHKIYNITYGKNILHSEIADILEKYGINVKFTNSANHLLPPIFSNKRLCMEYTCPKKNVLDYIEEIIANKIMNNMHSVKSLQEK